jgi:hypothetical protein
METDSNDIVGISNHDYIPKSQTINANLYQPKIAYIFAGSARSLVCPKVHWSIKLHLIDAMGGDPYVFIRVAKEDNLNTKTGKGKIWTPGYNDAEINASLAVLNPVKITHFSFTTQEADMIRDYPGIAHKVYRENDQRRYSMYYHRCTAYKMMLEYEVENKMTFDWVVLVRLDAAWLEPVLPIHVYKPDRV